VSSSDFVDWTSSEHHLDNGIKLVPLSKNHTQSLINAFANDPNSVRIAMPWLDTSLSIEFQIQSFIFDVTSGPNSIHYHHWVLIDQNSEEIVGLIGFDVVRFRTIERKSLSRGVHWNLGYWIAPNFRLRGLASKSIDIMIYIASKSKVDVVQLSAAPDNLGGLITIRSAVGRHQGIISDFGVEMIEENEGNIVPYEAYWILTGE
tara:strand:+ start:90 stop:701 length:612 start_codon:yes stop_codon:yes gene_type:complete